MEALPKPPRTPDDEVLLPGETTSRLLPSELIWSRTRSWAPWPRPTVRITDETPMMMPSMVSAERNRWETIADQPVRRVSAQVMATISPSRTASTRPARAATSCSWVISTIVRPRPESSSSSASTSPVEPESRLPVGSSARISAGSVTSARATATRCCCPPESSPGLCSARSSSPTFASASRARRLRSWRGTAAYIRGSSTLRHAFRLGSRLNCWKTNPIRRLRTSASRASLSSETSSPARWYSPLVGTSRQPRMCISVDLPDPLGPMTATYSPSSMRASTPRSASTWMWPVS